MDLDMRELEAFAAVVEQSSFSKAAKVLFLTQPTVSSHIASLEKKLDTRLLIRTSRTVCPSDAGRLLYDYARRILDLRTQATEAIAAFSREMRGTIHIAASDTPGQYYLPRLIRDFRGRFPDIDFDLEVLPSKAVAARVASRTVDLGFTGTVVSLPACVYQTLAEDQFVIVTPDTPAYRSYLPTGLPPRQLAREPFVTREEGSHSWMEMEHFLHALDVPLRELHIAVRGRSTAELLRLVSEGSGVALVPHSACLQFSRPLLSFDYDTVHLRQKIYLVRHKNNVLSPSVQAFVRYLLQTCLSEGNEYRL